MKYILSDVNKKVGTEIKKKSFIVDDQLVTYENERVDKLTFLRMNMNGFILTPSFIMNDFELATGVDYKTFKQRISTLIEHGCTTVISYYPIRSEQQFFASLKKAEHHMINSSIDYVIGIQIDANKLTPSLIRKCKRAKVPIILVTISDVNDFSLIPWQWLRDAMLTYQLLVIPTWKHLSITNKEAQFLKERWEELSVTHRIPTIYQLQDELKPLPKIDAQKIGLFPKKGELKAGSDVDYNLFHIGKQVKEIDSTLLVEKPDVVVLRGRVLKAGEKIEFYPGFGKKIDIHVPGHFLPISEAYKYVYD